MCKITLAELMVLGTAYSYANMQATVQALHDNVFGELGWVEYRPLAEGPQAFTTLAQQKTAAAKIVLQP